MMGIVSRLDETTRHFSDKVVDLVRGKTVEGQEQAHELVKYILSPKWDPGDVIEESVQPPRNQKEKLRNARYTRMIQNSLLFETIGYREDAIPEAYLKTNEWIFQVPYRLVDEKELWNSFPMWLKARSREIY
jgi:hypothetical protein